MAVSKSSKFQLAIAYESVFGTKATGNLKEVRHTGGIPVLNRTSVTSSEIRKDRQIAGHYLGVKSVSGDIPCELSFGGAIEDMMAFACSSSLTWATPASTTATTISAATAATISVFASTSTPFAAYATDDIVLVSGFTSATNVGWYKLTGATDATLTVDSDLLAPEAAGASVTIKRYAYVSVDGEDPGTFTVQAQLTDLTTTFLYWTGVGMSTMDLGVTVDAPVTVGFGLVGATEATAAATLATVDDAPEISPMNGFGGTLYIGTSTSYHVSEANLTLDNGGRALHAIGSADAFALNFGRSLLSGTLTAFVEDLTLRAAFLNQTEALLRVDCQDPDGNKYLFVVPRIVYTGADIDVSPDEPLMQSLPFQALKHAYLDTNFIICKE